jgi:hypothetical protein
MTKDKTCLEILPSELNDEAREFFVSRTQKEYISAFEIGVSVLNRAGMSKDLDFVRSNALSIMASIDKQTTSLGSLFQNLSRESFDPNVPTSYTNTFTQNLIKESASFQKALNAQMSAVSEAFRRVELTTSEGDGSVLGSLKKAVVGVQDFIQQQLDGSHTAGFAYRFREQFLEMLTTMKKDSASTIEESVRRETAELLRVVNDGFTHVRETLAGAEARAEVMGRTAVKGVLFEEALYETLMEIASREGDVVEPSGTVRQVGGSKKGDFLYTTYNKHLIVIECKDKPVSLKESLDYMKLALEGRGSKLGILVAKESTQLQKQIGRWNVYDNVIICCSDDIELTIKVAKIYTKLLSVSSDSDSINLAVVHGKLSLIAEQMQRLTIVRAKLTGMTKSVTEGSSQIDMVLTEMKTAIDIQIADINKEVLKAKDVAA